MPVWRGEEVTDIEGTKEVWKNASLEKLFTVQGLSLKQWFTWIELVTDIIDDPNASVYDVGCGTGNMINVLPDTIEYYGNDINEEFISVAKEVYGDRPNTTILLEDLYDTFDKNLKFDYVFATSLFGFFPEDESYSLLARFWDMCDKGMGISTLNKDLYLFHPDGKPRRIRNQLTSHDPRQMEEFLKNLPGVGEVTMMTDIPKEKWSIRRGMVIHVRRK